MDRGPFVINVFPVLAWFEEGIGAVRILKLVERDQRRRGMANTADHGRFVAERLLADGTTWHLPVTDLAVHLARGGDPWIRYKIARELHRETAATTT